MTYIILLSIRNRYLFIYFVFYEYTKKFINIQNIFSKVSNLFLIYLGEAAKELFINRENKRYE